MSKYDSNLDLCFSALGDPTRRMILQRLARGEATVSELAEPHDMALPTFLKHLSKLEEAGLVRSEKKGRVRTVHIEAAPLAKAESWLKKQRAIWEGRRDRLARLAENPN